MTISLYVDDLNGSDDWSGECNDPPVAPSTCGPKKTIQAGIDATQADCDQVVVGDGTYTGPGNRDLIFTQFSNPSAARLITVRSQNGAENCIIDCENSGRAFAFDHQVVGADLNRNAVVEGFTITNGSAYEGAAVWIAGTGPTIRGCLIKNNTASTEGGAIYAVKDANPLIQDCTIGGSDQGNSAGTSGGGLYFVEGDTGFTVAGEIRNCTISHNYAARDGGGIYVGGSSNTLIKGCIILRNMAGDSGGGIVAAGHAANVRIANCLVLRNVALSDFGGGLAFLGSGGGTQMHARMVNVAVASNRGIHGGGVYLHGFADLELADSTIAYNTDSGSGGGIRNNAHPDHLDKTEVNDSILWANSAPQISALYTDTVTVAYTDVQGGCASIPNVQCGLGNIDADPDFADPDGIDDIFGTEDDDYRLQSGSPCIDSANNNLVPQDYADLDEDGDDEETTPLDLDWFPRFIDDPGAPDVGDSGNGYDEMVDMGAYESRLCPGAYLPEAELLPLCPEPEDTVSVKNRFLSMRVGTPGRDQAIRVTVFALPAPFHIWNGQVFYAGAPRAVCENAGQGWTVGPNPDVPGVSTSPCGPSLGVYENGQDYFWVAPLVCDSANAHFMDWGTLANHCNTPGAAALDAYPCSEDAECQDAGNPRGTCGVSDVVHLYHEGVVPSLMVAGAGPIDHPEGEAGYRIQAIDSDCIMNDEADYSPAMPMTQAGWGDLVLSVADCPNWPPEESVILAADITALLNKFSNLPCAIQKARADLVPCLVDVNIGIPDVVAVLGAFGGGDYEDTCGSGQCEGVAGGGLLCRGGPDHNLPCTTDLDCSSDVCWLEGEAASGAGATGGSTPTPGATAAFTLTTSRTVVQSGNTIDVHVFARGVKDLRAYEVKLNVDGGTNGEVALADLRIDTDRADYVFSGLKEVHATDLSGSRIGGALVSGAIDAVAPVYLGTYTYQTSARAAGVFSVSVDLTSGGPVLMDSMSTPVPFAAPSALLVSVGETE